jgi:hypothetical protein
MSLKTLAPTASSLLKTPLERNLIISRPRALPRVLAVFEDFVFEATYAIRCLYPHTLSCDLHVIPATSTSSILCSTSNRLYNYSLTSTLQTYSLSMTSVQIHRSSTPLQLSPRKPGPSLQQLFIIQVSFIYSTSLHFGADSLCCPIVHYLPALTSSINSCLDSLVPITTITSAARATPVFLNPSPSYISLTGLCKHLAGLCTYLIGPCTC